MKHSWKQIAEECRNALLELAEGPEVSDETQQRVLRWLISRQDVPEWLELETLRKLAGVEGPKETPQHYK